MNMGTGYKIIRKNSDGCTVKWDRKNATLRTEMPSSYLDKELRIASILANYLKDIRDEQPK